ncbi:hypothetical protein K9M09_02100 [Patescibacteria group bacterium]|nr:hypothetical protein [Patescibacteria group bacterium]
MPNSEKKIISAEDKKRLILRVGVIGISLFIMILWLVSLTFSFGSKNIKVEMANNSWRQDLQNTINSVRDDLGDKVPPTAEEKTFLESMLTNIENKDQIEMSSTTEGTTETTLSEETESQRFLEALKDNLPATEAITSSCPAYINCMPTIGQARPCVIPAGCEAITQIAY